MAVSLGATIVAVVWMFGWASLADQSGAGLLRGWAHVVIYAGPVALTGVALVRTFTSPAPRRWLWASALLGMAVYWLLIAVLVAVVMSQVA